MNDKDQIRVALENHDRGFAVIVVLNNQKRPPDASRQAVEMRSPGLALLDSPVVTPGEEAVFVKSTTTGHVMAVWLDELVVAQPRLV